MSEVTAEQLRETVDDALSFYSGVEEAMPDAFQMLVYSARLLADAPLTLAALQAGAEEVAGGLSTIPGTVVLVPRSQWVLDEKALSQSALVLWRSLVVTDPNDPTGGPTADYVIETARAAVLAYLEHKEESSV